MANSKRVRSPNYPAVSLEEAIEKARVLYDREITHFTGIDVASAHWKYKSASTGGALIIAALSAYGLAETKGSGSDRQVRINDTGRKLILDQRPKTDRERLELLRMAALSPKLHNELWEKWGGELPSDNTIRHYLVLERNFNEGTVVDFIANYKKTLDFAGLLGPATIPPEEESPDTHVPFGEGGLPEAMQLAGFGFPKTAQPNKLTQSASGSKMIQDTLNLAEGLVVFQWPSELSQESYEDLKAWLELEARRVGRAVRPASITKNTDQETA